MEAMEGDMTWNWNAGQQMNPHFLAQHLQSQPLNHDPARTYFRSYSADRLLHQESSPATYTDDMQHHLGRDGPGIAPHMRLDDSEGLRATQKPRDANAIAWEQGHDLLRDDLQVGAIETGIVTDTLDASSP